MLWFRRTLSRKLHSWCGADLRTTGGTSQIGKSRCGGIGLALETLLGLQLFVRPRVRLSAAAQCWPITSVHLTTDADTCAQVIQNKFLLSAGLRTVSCDQKFNLCQEGVNPFDL